MKRIGLSVMLLSTVVFGQGRQFSEVTIGTKSTLLLNTDHVRLDSHDPVTATRPTLYSTDGRNWYEYKQPIAFYEDGRHRLQYYSLLADGGKGSLKTIDFVVDRQAPRTSLLLVGKANQRDGVSFVRGRSSVRLAAQDHSSGVKTIWVRSYIYGEEPPAYDVYDEKLRVLSTRRGEVSVIEYYGEDQVGNKEQPKSRYFQIDNRAPSIYLLNNPELTRRRDFVRLTWRLTDDLLPVTAEVYLNGSLLVRQRTRDTINIVVNRLRQSGATVEIIATDALGNKRSSAFKL